METRVSVEGIFYRGGQISFSVESFGIGRVPFHADEKFVRKGSRAIEHKRKMPSNVANYRP